MKDDTFMYKVESKPLKRGMELQWYLTEQLTGRLVNQFLIGKPDDEEYEPDIISLDVGDMKEARSLWKGLINLVGLCWEKPKDD